MLKLLKIGVAAAALAIAAGGAASASPELGSKFISWKSGLHFTQPRFAPTNDPSGPETDGISNCTGTDGSLVCNLFETDANGNPSEVSTLILPSVGSGMGVILENPALGDAPSNWSDIFLFSSNPDGTSTLTFASDPATLAYANIPVGVFLDESSTGVTRFCAGTIEPTGACSNNDYYFHSDPPEAPEPATLALVGTAIAGLGALRRRKAI